MLNYHDNLAQFGFKDMINTQVNFNGQLFKLDNPKIMGIVNCTSDSFYANSRANCEKDLLSHCANLLDEGADILDIGACSTRPFSIGVSEEEETKRLQWALALIRKEFGDIFISVDTYRSKIARFCVNDFGVCMINDVSGGNIDPNMFTTIAELGVVYVLSHIVGSPENMQINPQYEDIIGDISLYFAHKTAQLRKLGVSDIILDPGFGFGKNLDQNYHLLAHIKDLQIHDMPIMVGLSRKSMIRDVLNTSVEDSLNGTTALNMAALLSDCVNILRVHDVKEAVECKKLYQQLRESYHP